MELKNSEFIKLITALLLFVVFCLGVRYIPRWLHARNMQAQAMNK